CALYVDCILFFFFQAEDGIRDFHVTGVQTCALPIFDADDGAGGHAREHDLCRVAGGAAGGCGDGEGLSFVGAAGDFGSGRGGGAVRGDEGDGEVAVGCGGGESEQPGERLIAGGECQVGHAASSVWRRVARGFRGALPFRSRTGAGQRGTTALVCRQRPCLGCPAAGDGAVAGGRTSGRGTGPAPTLGVLSARPPTRTGWARGGGALGALP